MICARPSATLLLLQKMIETVGHQAVILTGWVAKVGRRSNPQPIRNREEKRGQAESPDHLKRLVGHRNNFV